VPFLHVLAIFVNRTSELGSCEYGNEPSGSIKGGEFLDLLSDC